MSSSLLWLSLLLAQTDGQRGTLESVEGTRGGRHWIDQKTQPPKSAAESLDCFQIEPGAKIELVAAEPLVADPVAIAFDHHGRMFVVEYGDYPTGPVDPEAKSLSRVVLIENALDDDQPKKRHVFADNLTFAHSLMSLMDGILVGAQTQIIFLKDTDGDNVADVREVWFDGFNPAHPQMQIGNPRWGFDNRIYLNYGTGKVRMTRPGFPPSEPVDMPRKEFWFDPLTMEFGPAGGLGQFGNTIDRRGYRFFTTNRNPIMVNMIPLDAVKRNPFAIIPKTHTDVGPSGGDTRVYPLVDMKSNYLSHAGTHTSACGVTAYLGDLFEGDYRDSVFVCEPIGHLVTRTIVTPDPNSVGLIAKRAREKADFLASTDTWFRPASLTTGPDGALYLADMYRLWVEHPKFLPDEIAARIDWRAGEDRGRIWRITPPDSERRAWETPKSNTDLVRMLIDESPWRRLTAQQLLVERQAVDVVKPLQRLAMEEDDTPLEGELTRRIRLPIPRDHEGHFKWQLHALWTLHGLGKLTGQTVADALHSSDPEVQRHAAILAGKYLASSPGLIGSLAFTMRDSTPQVRFQAVLSLGSYAEHSTSTDTLSPATQVLAGLARRDGGDPWMNQALIASAHARSAQLAAAVRSQFVPVEKKQGPVSEHYVNLVRELAVVTGARGDVDELVELLKFFRPERYRLSWWETAVATGLSRGLPRHRAGVVPRSLPGLIADAPVKLRPYVKHVQTVLLNARSVAMSSDERVANRVAAIPLLAQLPFDDTAETFTALLDSRQPIEVQQATMSVLRQSGRAEAAQLVLDRWSQLGPETRGAALNLLWSRTTSTKLALQAMADGQLPAAVVDIDRRVRLLKHGDETIRKLSGQLFGGVVSANRREVADRYRPALTMPDASATGGVAVFKRICSKCHKLDGQGSNVGPDISDVRNRSREALLFDILDPNRKVEPRFMDYSVVTTDGRTFNGLMVSETPEAVVLRQAEGKQQIIPRNDIEILKASGRSLMPEGVEKDVTVQQMADLLEFLKARKSRPGTP